MKHLSILALVSVGFSLPMIQARQSSNVAEQFEDACFAIKENFYIRMNPKLPKKDGERILALNLCLRNAKTKLSVCLSKLSNNNNPRCVFFKDSKNTILHCFEDQSMVIEQKACKRKVQMQCKIASNYCLFLLMHSLACIEPAIASIFLPIFTLHPNYPYTSLLVMGLLDRHNKAFWSTKIYAKNFEKTLSLLNQHGVDCMLKMKLSSFLEIKATSTYACNDTSMPLALCLITLEQVGLALNQSEKDDFDRDEVTARRIDVNKQNHSMLACFLTSYLKLFKNFKLMKIEDFKDIVDTEYSLNIPKQICQNIVSFINTADLLGLNDRCKITDLQCLDFFDKKEKIYANLQSFGAQHSPKFDRMQQKLSNFQINDTDKYHLSMCYKINFGVASLWLKEDKQKEYSFLAVQHLPKVWQEEYKELMQHQYADMKQRDEPFTFSFISEKSLLFLIYKAFFPTI